MAIPVSELPGAIAAVPSAPPLAPSPLALFAGVVALLVGLLAMPLSLWNASPRLGAIATAVGLTLAVGAGAASLLLKLPGWRTAGVATLVCSSALASGLQIPTQAPGKAPPKRMRDGVIEDWKVPPPAKAKAL